GVNALIVNGDARALDGLVDNGDQGRLLSRQGNGLLDKVLEILAQFGSHRRAGDALAKVHVIRLSCLFQLLDDLLAGFLGLLLELSLSSWGLVARSARLKSIETGPWLALRLLVAFPSPHGTLVGWRSKRCKDLRFHCRPRHEERFVQIHLKR